MYEPLGACRLYALFSVERGPVASTGRQDSSKPTAFLVTAVHCYILLLHADSFKSVGEQVKARPFRPAAAAGPR
jgi:hypothetical protein